MPDELPDNQSDQAQGADAAETRPLTAEDFARERDRMFADMRKMVEGIVKKQGKAEPAPKARSESAEPDWQEALRAERDFNDAMAEHPQLSKHRQMIRRLFDAEKPDNVADWVRTTAEAFAPPAPASPPGKTETATEPPVQPNPRPASNGGAPARSSSLESGEPVWRLDVDAIERLRREKGPHAAARIIRDRLYQDLQGRAVYIPKKG